jgi:origin recognition complex subunit 1
MAPVQQRSRIEKARQILAGGAVLREDSDDELGYDDHPWEWIYEDTPDAQPAEQTTPRKRKAAPTSSGRRIVGARMGNFSCKLVRFEYCMHVE